MDFLIQKVFAEGSSHINNVSSSEYLPKILNYIIYPLIYFLMAISIAFIVWGIIMFIRETEKHEKRDVGDIYMMIGIIGICITMLAKGIIRIILYSIGL